MKLGIAAYFHFDNFGNPLLPQWALVAHPTSFLATDVMVFRITEDRPRHWSAQHTSCSLRHSPTLIGVIDMGTADISPHILASVARAIDPNNSDKFDPSGMRFWSDISWVIKVLNALHIHGSYELSVPSVNDIWPPVEDASQAMKRRLPKRARVPSDRLDIVAFCSAP